MVKTNRRFMRYNVSPKRVGINWNLNEMTNKKARNKIIFRIDAITQQLCEIAELCGIHDQMQLVPHLEKMYDQIEQIKHDPKLNVDDKDLH